MKPFKLSPSDFAFLWEECPRCFYLKVVQGISRPRTPMPKIFTTIDRGMRDHFHDRATQDIDPRMPVGVIRFGERWVESQPIQPPGVHSACYIRGKFDTLAVLEDGSYAVIDFKTTERKPEHLDIYARQLHAYALALEQPAAGKFSLSPVSCLGLLVFEPATFHSQGQDARLDGSLAWVELPYHPPAFMVFLKQVVALLEHPDPPPSSTDCEYCRYRKEKA